MTLVMRSTNSSQTQTEYNPKIEPYTMKVTEIEIQSNDYF